MVITDNSASILWWTERASSTNLNPVIEAIYRINVHQPLWEDICYRAMHDILHDKSTNTDLNMWILLNGLMAVWPSENEVIWLLRAAFELDNLSLENQREVILPGNKKLIGMIGSWKKWHKTINISTAAWIIASANWTYFAKPWSSSTSSITWSADILKEVWANIDVTVDTMIDILQKTGFGFFQIENLIPNFDKKYWWKFFAPHALSLALPALVCPIKLDRMVYWLAHPNIETSIKVFDKLGIKNVFVVSATDDGIHYIDEIGIYWVTKTIWIKDWEIWPLTFFDPWELVNMPRYTYEHIKQGNNVQENVKYFVDVLNNKWDQAKEDIICINAASLIYIAGECNNIKEGFYIAKQIIKDWKAIAKLIEFIEATWWDINKLNKYL